LPRFYPCPYLLYIGAVYLPITHMGKLSDLLRAQLRELAQSDARRLRAIDQALKDSRAADDQLKRLK
jgi:hypothetical protein